MNLDYFIARLSTNRGVFEDLVKGLSLDQARWMQDANPSDG